MNELEQMAIFCEKYPYVYIYGYEAPQRYIAKYMKMAKLQFNGYIVPEVPVVLSGESHEVISILNTDLSELDKHAKVGIIISIDECRYTQVIELLQSAGFHNYFFVSEWNKRTIPFKMTPRSIENFWFEVNLADHCNLNCQCCDHFAPLAPPFFLDLEEFTRDVNRIAELTNHRLRTISLLGGEPLLNEQLIDYIRVARQAFPDAIVVVFTDGLLLRKWGERTDNNLWEAVKKYEVEIRVTVYPIAVDFAPVKDMLCKCNIPFSTDPPPPVKGARVWFLTEVGDFNHIGAKQSTKHPFDLEGNQDPYRFISCYQFNESIVLRHGRIYTCPVIPYSKFFSDYFHKSLEICPEDSIDIYTADSYDEIAEFLTHRVPFCRYCMVQCRSTRDWRQSKHSVKEWTL